ncbi:MAG: hydrogenase maturation nickel metallochaperone HypA [Candidatus Competibacteraceae bacterium]|uniref:Hydrogenase maturation factor HypA n=1 Tax=Candidatus Contendobacter odensis Run_B_J11 TaxID=1400861 RepID=A0A7U7G9R2_9GAMM|nr:hydrogenase maturation nickel metallochaperone HypA [Candidatus Contendobacter odensis]MBK8534839.1 hydrogenase maturation nickel metallochaperone HypA [Candidatus Competibacteraceae bacterium]MBK8753513.1 hydrogenase maturation nickel metallochaperone HypA [Candidatus Competibacteraceae bacterium]CDH44470.1 putative hydrogenase nickel incorporation protein hypA [Candidatus Contendobacter odensis Run_B_J11]
MHELSLCEGIIETITTQVHQRGFKRVLRVWLEIGELANVEPESLRFAFAAIRCDTIAATAELEIITLPGRAHCLDCAQTVAVQQHFDPCPLCGGYQWRLLSGTEMRIKELEVE